MKCEPGWEVIQLQWQNPLDLRDTQLVAQFDAKGFDGTPEEFNADLAATLEKHKESCPKGWHPLWCNESYETFFLAFWENGKQCIARKYQLAGAGG